MALRAFHANPSIGGFGGENSTPNLLRSNDRRAVNSKKCCNGTPPAQNTGDAFCQIVKELVDNAVDAVNSSMLQKDQPKDDMCAKKRIRVLIEPYENSKSNSSSSSSNDSDSPTPDLLRITVTDNGIGMEDIHQCVNAFQTSKGASQSQGNVDEDMHKNTSGRYGIGLTLCLLHAQRLVPYSCASITSTKKGWGHIDRALFVVDPEGDQVLCESQKRLTKDGGKEVSGTCVSLLLPGGSANELTWSRLVAYFRRFNLCPDITFGLEILAPTLERIPIFIRPKHQLAGGLTSVSEDPATSTNMVIRAKSTPTIFEEDSWKDVAWDDTETQPGEKESEEESCTPTTPPDLAAQTCPQRMKIVEAAKAYWPNRKIVLKNVASSIQKIRLSEQQSKKRTSVTDSDVLLEVDMIVCPISSIIVSPDDDFSLASLTDQRRNTDQQTAAPGTQAATLELVRMVNDVPMLDGAEAHSCGLVHALENKTLWGSFGLDVRRKSPGDGRSASTTPGKCRWMQTFNLHDHDQVSDYIQKDSNHKQLLSLVDDTETSESEDDDDDDLNSLDSLARKRKRRSNGHQELLPASARLHEVLVVVRIRAAPSALPLPTLSKGRLPLNHGPISTALYRGLNDCLRSLQSTNGSLLLSHRNLQGMVRDVRYVPKLASEVALSVCQSHNAAFRHYCNSILELASRLNSTKLDGNAHPEEHRGRSQVASSVVPTNELSFSELEKAIRLLLVFTLREKKKAEQVKHKRSKKRGKIDSAAPAKSQEDAYKEIGCGDHHSSQSVGTSQHHQSIAIKRDLEKEGILSTTSSWGEVGVCMPLPAPATEHPRTSEEQDDEPNDVSAAPLKEIVFSSEIGVPIYESDDSFDDDDWD